ncbi:MAG TPA: hypothetical protein VFY93_05265 [Planctomycetota bacterium]|nr:hypothetical protein [Planctomycetota bacterium]
MTKPRKTHSLRPGEPLALCGAVAWTVRIVPAAVEPSCGTCRRIREFRSKARERRRRI